jgi:hypothetical protein
VLKATSIDTLLDLLKPRLMLTLGNGDCIIYFVYGTVGHYPANEPKFVICQRDSAKLSNASHRNTASITQS